MAAKMTIKTGTARKRLLLFRYSDAQKALRPDQDNGDENNQGDDVGDFGGGQGGGKRGDQPDDEGADEPAQEIAHSSEDHDDEGHHRETPPEMGVNGVDGGKEGGDDPGQHSAGRHGYVINRLGIDAHEA